MPNGALEGTTWKGGGEGREKEKTERGEVRFPLVGMQWGCCECLQLRGQELAVDVAECRDLYPRQRCIPRALPSIAGGGLSPPHAALKRWEEREFHPG